MRRWRTKQNEVQQAEVFITDKYEQAKMDSALRHIREMAEEIRVLTGERNDALLRADSAEAILDEAELRRPTKASASPFWEWHDNFHKEQRRAGYRRDVP